jgi:hypothetical protein
VSVEYFWPDIILRHYNDMFISQWGNPWPDMNIMQMVKHYNKMASFVVKVQQPLPVLRR